MILRITDAWIGKKSRYCQKHTIQLCFLFLALITFYKKQPNSPRQNITTLFKHNESNPLVVYCIVHNFWLKYFGYTDVCSQTNSINTNSLDLSCHHTPSISASAAKMGLLYQVYGADSSIAKIQGTAPKSIRDVVPSNIQSNAFRVLIGYTMIWSDFFSQNHFGTDITIISFKLWYSAQWNCWNFKFKFKCFISQKIHKIHKHCMCI